jgi:hypothetical protein
LDALNSVFGLRPPTGLFEGRMIDNLTLGAHEIFTTAELISAL